MDGWMDGRIHFVTLMLFPVCSRSLHTDEALTEETDIELPKNVIDGSARATRSVLGKLINDLN